ncbi:MAG: cupredoxin domain-containing protein [Nanoarchaeota archaeon]|nr:cupredoxin domain-containing protein [Nanoarchaeota archaeon]
MPLWIVVYRHLFIFDLRQLLMGVYSKRFLLVLGLSLFTVGLLFFIFECTVNKSCFNILSEKNVKQEDIKEIELEKPEDEKNEKSNESKTEIANESVKDDETSVGNDSTNKSFDNLEVFLMVSPGTFKPSVITIYVGQELTIRAYAKEEDLGISIPEFNISKDLVLDKYTDITIISNKTGKFKFMCNSACKSGYANMKGFINVIE